MMIFQPLQKVETDVLVIGGGGAGLRAAITARQAGVAVTLISKTRVGVGNNTAISGGAFAAATGEREPKDNPEVHFRDTVIGGRFINDQRLVEVMSQAEVGIVSDLEQCGVQFRRREGRISIGLAPGHTYPRHFYGQNQIGTDFTRPLRATARKAGVKFAEGYHITRLFVANGRAVGALGLNTQGDVVFFGAKAIILACGGLGQLFLNTNNAASTTGDGYVLAYQVGLPLRDMEFVQFYPTALGARGSRNLLYEAFVARGGALLKNAAGDDILEKHSIKDPMLMTRDRLTRAIMTELLEGRGIGGKVTMDLSSVPPEQMERLLPLLPRESRGHRRFLVVPTAHHAMGGVVSDESCRTEVAGLYAAGEVCSGVHGANRLAGNALTEVFVFGPIAGREAANYAQEAGRSAPHSPEIAAEADKLRERAARRSTNDIEWLRLKLKETMWNKGGIIRSEKSLAQALTEINSLREATESTGVPNLSRLVKMLELQNMLLTAEMVCRAALMRTESRGAHYRSDYPQENNRDWLKHIHITRSAAGMNFTLKPVELWKLAP